MKTRVHKTAVVVALICLSLLSLGVSVFAQTTDFRYQSWRFGAHGAWQHNTAGLGWQQLHGTDLNFHSDPGSIDYVDGTGSSIYGGVFGEYLSSSWWGLQLRVSYDSRNAYIRDDTKNPIPSFDANMSYLVFEPLLRIDQNLIPRLSMTVGPIIAAKLNANYVYNPDPDNTSVEVSSENEPVIDVANANSLTYGLGGGFGYDIPLGNMNNHSSVLLTPFVDCSWLVAQKKTINEPDQNSLSDVWSTISYRLGLRLSFDYSSHTLEVADLTKPSVQTPQTAVPKVVVVLPPEQTIVTKQVQGYFPIHPYVFFEKGSTEIPQRYAMLTQAGAQNFKESDLEDFMKGDMTVQQTNVNQLMTTYYNVMNIYGDRMRRNPNEQLVLRGCDPEEKNGESYTQKVKEYLVNNFGINPSRIGSVIEAPKKPSGSSYTDPAFASLIDDENRRVVFVFSNPDMLKSVKYTIRDESSIDNDMVFSISNTAAFKSWDITITGEGRSMYFGPFSYTTERVNPAQIMRFLDNGSYNAKVVITELNGNQSEENVGFKLVKERQVRNASRYLMLFDYDQSDAIARYENRIRTEITPEMVPGNRVIVHGHTDIIGNAAGNLKLSQERADQAKSIIDAELKAESKVVSVQAIGVGQQEMQYTFDNRHPEGRMYNRNVFVEVIQ